MFYELRVTNIDSGSGQVHQVWALGVKEAARKLGVQLGMHCRPAAQGWHLSRVRGGEPVFRVERA